jgi:hypothetical protein
MLPLIGCDPVTPKPPAMARQSLPIPFPVRSAPALICDKNPSPFGVLSLVSGCSRREVDEHSAAWSSQGFLKR